MQTNTKDEDDNYVRSNQVNLGRAIEGLQKRLLEEKAEDFELNYAGLITNYKKENRRAIPFTSPNLFYYCKLGGETDKGGSKTNENAKLLTMETVNWV